jgi:hypothetical protein
LADWKASESATQRVQAQVRRLAMEQVQKSEGELAKRLLMLIEREEALGRE